MIAVITMDSKYSRTVDLRNSNLEILPFSGLFRPTKISEKINIVVAFTQHRRGEGV